MATIIDKSNDNTVVPETPYQGDPKPVSGRSTSRSLWALGAGAVFIIGLGVFVVTTQASRTDPAPYGAGPNTGMVAQPAPTQNK